MRSRRRLALRLGVARGEYLGEASDGLERLGEVVRHDLRETFELVVRTGELLAGAFELEFGRFAGPDVARGCGDQVPCVV
ncbi:MAG: hypothetical protein ACXVHB_23960 [Solirubrobacteraceae bacterium]